MRGWLAAVRTVHGASAMPEPLLPSNSSYSLNASPDCVVHNNTTATYNHQPTGCCLVENVPFPPGPTGSAPGHLLVATSLFFIPVV
eukprot:490034-Pleurochrysis_carterae.AAC.1